MKGIILVGGKGTRLYPLTISSHKQLLPIYDKPMIYYSLATLMEAGIKDIIVISTEEYMPRYKKLLGDGSNLGINLSYTFEPSSKGIAQAFTLAADFIGDDNVCLILGDNIYLGDMRKDLRFAMENAKNGRATIFGYVTDEVQRLAAIEYDKNNRVIGLEEKPKVPKSNLGQTGIYVYTNEVVEYARNLKPSARGELEVTDVNKIFMENGKLDVVIMDGSVKWFDAGTLDSLLDASMATREMERANHKKYGCIEEVAYKNKWITKEQLLARANELMPSDYAKELLEIAK